MEFVDPRFLDHFMHPRNTGTVESPDGTGMSGAERHCSLLGETALRNAIADLPAG
ncbi:MAG TPA: hypothetical protein VLA34_13230 [Candidatus Krumholzibacterium sp.]|nr:hypothetical protein [Candidatus Krumholzibacterium sp.]